MFNVFDRRRQSNDEQVDELLSAYVDGLLRPDERKKLEARLEREPALRERLEGMRFAVAALADLPELDVPRNFILAPSMVAAPGTAPPPRRRWNWPVLGWATAVATLLLLFVLAGDFFVVAPSLRQETSDVTAQERPSSEPAEAAPLLESLPEEPVAEPAEGELPVIPEVEKEAVTMAEAGDEAPGERVPAPEGAELPAAAEEMPGPTPAAEATRDVFAAEALPTESAQLDAAETPPTGGGGMAPTATLEPTALPPSLSLSPTPPPEQKVSPVMQETAQAVAEAPLEEAPAPISTREVAESVPLWLRLLEIVLALLVVSRAVATVMVRRRAV